MPHLTEARISIILPKHCKLGWAESPAYFCTATETGRDIIEMLLREGVELPEHPLERFMQRTKLPETAPPGAEETTSVGVYVHDD